MLFNRLDNILPEFRHIINHSMTTVQIHLLFLLLVKFHQLNLANEFISYNVCPSSMSLGKNTFSINLNSSILLYLPTEA